MECNYCGTQVSVIQKNIHVHDENGIDVGTILVCQTCLKKYTSKLFDTCDDCGELYELKPRKNVFQVISGKMYCPTCAGSVIESRSARARNVY